MRIVLVPLLLVPPLAWGVAVHPRTVDEYLLREVDGFGPEAQRDVPSPDKTRTWISPGGQVVTVMVPVQAGASEREDRRLEVQRLLLEGSDRERALAVADAVAADLLAAEAAVAAGGDGRDAAVAELAALRAIQAEIDAALAEPAP